MASRKPAGIYVKPSPEVIEYFKKKAEENRRALADEVGLFLDKAVLEDENISQSVREEDDIGDLVK